MHSKKDCITQVILRIKPIRQRRNLFDLLKCFECSNRVLQVLFRIVELSQGSVLIDDVDIGTVPLSILRSRLAIIPQDPVLLTGSIRFQLDPFETYSDTEVWDALAGAGEHEGLRAEHGGQAAGEGGGGRGEPEPGAAPAAVHRQGAAEEGECAGHG